MEDRINKLENALWDVWEYLEGMPCYPDDLRELLWMLLSLNNRI